MEACAPIDEFSDQLPAALAPYAAALEAEGFEVSHTERSVRGTWEPVPEVYYFCHVLMQQGNIVALMHRMRPNVWIFSLFHWTQITTPAELRWLLQRSMELQTARTNPAGETAIRGLLQTTDDATVARLPRQEALYKILSDGPTGPAAPV